MDHDQTLPELTLASSPIWTLCCFKSVPIGCWSRDTDIHGSSDSGIITGRVGREAGLRTHEMAALPRRDEPPIAGVVAELHLPQRKQS